MRCSGDVSIPGRLPMDRKMTRGCRREVRRKSSTRTNRLDSPMPSKPALITDYYTRAPRMMSGDEKLGFDGMDGWEDVTQQYLDKSTQGVVVDKAKPEEDDIVDWPGTEEDIEEWTGVILERERL